MKKICPWILLSVLLISVICPAASAEASAEYTVDLALTDGSFENIDSFSTYESAYNFFCSRSDRDTVLRSSSGKVIAMKEGMAVTDSSDAVLVFSSTLPGNISAYCQNGVACWYISTDSSQYATISVASFRGSCHVSELILIPSAHVYPRKTGSRANRYEFDCYMAEDGDLVHYISLYSWSRDVTDFYGLTVDRAPSFMEEHIRYYSLDGIHYYTDPYDAVKGRNCVGTHYIYFDQLSFRTKTSYTAEEIDAYIAYRNSTYSSIQCIYLGDGDAFIEAQDTYGVNALMELSFADHESAYGTSEIARDKNNIFGINAVDSAAYSNANYYTTVTNCILEHARYTISRGYLDAYAYIDGAKDTSYYDIPGTKSGWIVNYSGDSRYFGPNLGNKEYGVNVKYASDPWHGEKIAAKTYVADKYLGSKDYGKYTIGVTNKVTTVYASPDTDSWKVYKISSCDPSRSRGYYSDGPVGISVIILGEEGDFYRIQSDMAMNSEGRASCAWDYDFDLSVGYVLKSDIDLVYSEGDIPMSRSEDPEVDSEEYEVIGSNGTVRNISPFTPVGTFRESFENGSARVYQKGNEVTSGNVGTGMDIKFYDENGTYTATYTAVVRADLNGDGNITSTDIVILARHLAGIDSLTGAKLEAADINGSGSVTSTDIVLLARHLSGIQTIE